MNDNNKNNIIIIINNFFRLLTPQIHAIVHYRSKVRVRSYKKPLILNKTVFLMTVKL